jgi:hypothetical protein
MTFRRLLTLAVLALLALGVLWEPYTAVLHRSDVILPAPLWQICVAYFDIAILIAVGSLSLKGRVSTAYVLLCLEVTFYLCRNAILLVRDGWDLFVYGDGLGPVSVLNEYVAFILLRGLLLWLLRSSSSAAINAAA